MLELSETGCDAGTSRMASGLKQAGETAPLSQTSRDLVGRVQGSGSQLTLAVYHRHGVAVAPLQPGKPIVVGRSAPADLVVAETGLSRTHARFTLAGGSLTVEDLGSTNGTRVRGELVERAALAAGEPVLLGTVVAAVHLAAVHEAALGIEDHDRFVAALELQLGQARYFREPLALAMVRSASGAHVSEWCEPLRALLRPVDVVGIYSQDAALVMLPRMGEAAAGEVLERLCRAQALLAGTAEGGTSADRLLERCRRALLAATTEQPVRSAATPEAPPPGDAIIASSPVMIELFEMVDQLAGSELPVLLVGETGSGKEVVARAIHQRSRRRGRRLVCVNCAAIPEQLVESTLFGHERGAFTGADRAAEGMFGAADGGTLLLDEVGELSSGGQAALLRALDAGSISRVGSPREIPVDVRILAATHKNLEALAAAGSFRQDLFYRLNAATLFIPALRDRGEEIAALAERFLRGASEATGRALRGIRPEALAALQRHAWPGNVRELRNVIERAAVIARGEWIELDDLPRRLIEARVLSDEPAAASLRGDLRESVRRYETDLVMQALARTGGSRTQAAELLGIPLRSLAHRMKVLGIKRGEHQAGR
jgi:two-component system, NtrC family, response regulator AtoC